MFTLCCTLTRVARDHQYITKYMRSCSVNSLSLTHSLPHPPKDPCCVELVYVRTRRSSFAKWLAGRTGGLLYNISLRSLCATHDHFGGDPIRSTHGITCPKTFRFSTTTTSFNSGGWLAARYRVHFHERSFRAEDADLSGWLANNNNNNNCDYA